MDTPDKRDKRHKRETLERLRKQEKLDNPERAAKPSKPSKPIEIKTSQERLDAVRDIYKSGKVRSIAHDPALHERFERARSSGTPKPDEDGYAEYARIRGKLSVHRDFDGKKGKRIHHIDFPRKKHPGASTDTRNLLLTDEATHKALHKATGGKGFEAYRTQEFPDHKDRAVRDSIKDHFNFQNPKSQVPLEKVKRKIELKQRLERVPQKPAKKPRG